MRVTAHDVPPDTVALISSVLPHIDMSTLPPHLLPPQVACHSQEVVYFQAPQQWDLHTPTTGVVFGPSEGIEDKPASASGMRRRAAQQLGQVLNPADTSSSSPPRPHVDSPEQMVASYERVISTSAVAHLYTKKLQGAPVEGPLSPEKWWEGHCTHCRNCQLRGRWQQAKETNDTNPCYIAAILAWLYHGWLPPFAALPQPFHEHNRPSLNKAPESAAKEMHEMEAGGVVVPVPESKYVSALGVVTKQSALDELATMLHDRHDHDTDDLLDGHDLDALNTVIEAKYGGSLPHVKARVTWDLSTHINTCMADLPYTTPDLDAVLPTIMSSGPTPLLFKWDFKRCFHDIPLHPQMRQYFCCHYEGRFLQATRAIFGGSPHPFVANTLTGESQLICQAAELSPQAILRPTTDRFPTSLWVDDNLGAGETMQQARDRKDRVVAVATTLGWTIPEDHIDGPDPSMTFRGIIFDPIALTLSIPQAKLMRLQRTIRALLLSTHDPFIREVRSIVGKCQ